MKITESQLKRIIKEEVGKTLYEWDTRHQAMKMCDDKVPIKFDRNSLEYTNCLEDPETYEYGPANVPDIGLEAPQSEEEMKAFIAKKFEPHMNIYSDAWDDALEKFEAKFNLDFPDSMLKIYDIVEDMEWARLASGLRSAYPEDFEGGEQEY